ncbi:MAG TPA: hypothetical protein P5531_10600 [Bacteroidales bacterium]|nr:hypothetical protein [Bacteroidales bacterium]HSA43589.1 hypothetical protein [Bacteroidales bacterium]
MKKFILSVTLLFLVVLSGFAQDKICSLKSDQYYQDITFSTRDTITDNDTLYTVDYDLNKAMPVKYNVAVKLTKVSGAPLVVASLQGKVFSTDTWTNITSVTWHGSSSDTTIKYTQNSTAQYYRFLRLQFDANTTAQKSRLTYSKFKLWDR